MKINIEHLLESRHDTTLRWFEPWEAKGPEGNTLYADITLEATVHDSTEFLSEILLREIDSVLPNVEGDRT